MLISFCEKSRHFAASSILVVSLFVSDSSLAQNANGAVGWCDGASQTCHSSPEAACNAQWVWAGLGPDSRLLSPVAEKSLYYNCRWTQYQYLCHEETGGGINGCGTVFPSYVEFICAAGFNNAGYGRCVPENEFVHEEASCSSNSGGVKNPAGGNPMIFASGTKLEYRTDFSTSDNLLQINRMYRSSSRGRMSVFHDLIRARIGGWMFDFSAEIHLDRYPNMVLYAADGTAYSFNYSSNGSVNSSNVRKPDYQISFVGTPPANWDELLASPSQWRMVDRYNKIWTFRTFRTSINSTGSFSVGRPVSISNQNGYMINFEYGIADEIVKITDSFGRSLNFSSNKYFLTSLPNVAGSLPEPDTISEIALWGGGKLRFTYDPPATVTPPSTSRAKRLVKFERLDGAGNLATSELYHYENTLYPDKMTGVTNHQNIRFASFQYDNYGRAISSEHTNGLDKTKISFSANGGKVLAQVTNPLGKVGAYSFSRNSDGSNLQLDGFTGAASANCVASNSTFSSGGDPFLNVEIDEEGRKTTYVRDDWGRPTSITRGAP